MNRYAGTALASLSIPGFEEMTALSIDAQRLLADALTLPAAERAAIAEGLLASLDLPVFHWDEETADRIAAFQAEETEEFSLEEAYAEFESL
jgi:hypothetical protein